MKGIAGVKRSLIKLLKENGWQEVSLRDITNKSEKVYYIFNSPCGNLLHIIYDNDLSFHFGYDKCLKTSAGVCLNGEQTDTEHFVLDYCNLCKDIILGNKRKEDVKI